MRDRHGILVLLPCFISLLLAAGGGCGGESAGDAREASEILDPDPVVFGLISTESSTGLRRDFDPFLADMEKEIGRKVVAKYATNYTGVVEGMRFGNVHVAWHGNKSAVEAVDRANAEVFAQTVMKDGSPGYWSVVIVHRDSPYQTIDDVIADAGQLSFANGDPNSTSGYLIPGYYLWSRRGVDPAKSFRRVVNANHESNCLAVANRQVDVATNNTEALVRFQNKQPDMYRQLRVIWKSPLIACDPVLYRMDLDPDLKDRIRHFFLSYGTEGRPQRERELDVLARLNHGWAPFAESSNQQLIPTREIMLAAEIAKLTERAADDPHTQRQIGELQTQLEELRRQQESPNGQNIAPVASQD